jgi:phosphate:Na+ symporter
MELFSINWWGSLIGGLGLFIFSIVFMGDALKKIAGNNLKSIIDKYTTNPIKGILVGIIVTVLLQTSSGSTALTIGLIRAGFMNLGQAIGIIMGANIGTTITAFLIGLKLTTYSPFILIIGAFLFIIATRNRFKRIGEVIFGFGGLFFGLSLIESALKPLARLPEFISFVQDLSQNPLLGILIGIIGTAAVQSSSAFVGILQGLYSASVDSNFTLYVAIPILFGSNIGTTITAIISSIGNSVPAKRTALAHVLFNLFGTVLFMIFINQYTSLLYFITNLLSLDPRMQIAFAHIIFNVITTLILIPFISKLTNLVIILIPSKTEPIEISKSYINEFDISVADVPPATALNIAKKQVKSISKLVVQSLEFIIKYIDTKDLSAREGVISIEKTIDDFDLHLTKFLNKIEKVSLEPNDVEDYTLIIKVFKDIERISDHCENLIEFFDEHYDRKEVINLESKKNILNMLNHSLIMVNHASFAFSEKRNNKISDIKELEIALDSLQKQVREKHLLRIAKGEEVATTFIALVFFDITSNIERIGDHCMNILESVDHLLPVHKTFNN